MHFLFPVGPVPPCISMNAERALAFIREHGVVLASAEGPVPCLTDAIVGEPVQGSHDTAFPQWVPPEVMEHAQSLSESEAVDALGSWVMLPTKRPAQAPAPKRRRRG